MWKSSTEDQQNEEETEGKMDGFHKGLVQKCLCDVSENVLRKTFEGYQVTDENGRRTATLYEWPPVKILQFLSNLQLLFDVYLKQRKQGVICSRIKETCDTLVRNEHCLVEQIISLCDLQNKYVNYVSARVLSRFFIIANKHMNKEWLESVVQFLRTENSDYVKMNFALEVIKWVVEWKDMEEHVLDHRQVSIQIGNSYLNPACLNLKLASNPIVSGAVDGVVIATHRQLHSFIIYAG